MPVHVQTIPTTGVATASPTAVPTLGESASSEIDQLRQENKRLRKENSDLHAQLATAEKSLRKTAQTSAESQISSATGLESGEEETKPATKSRKTTKVAEGAGKTKPEATTKIEKRLPPLSPFAETVTTTQTASTGTPAAEKTTTPSQTEPTPQAKPTAAPETKEPTNEDKAKAKFEEAQRYASTSSQGIKPLDEALELDPNNVEYQRALVTRLYYSKQYTTCARRGEEFIKGGATDSTIFIFTAAAYTSLNENTKALAILDRALKIDSKNGYALFNRALNLYTIKDPRAAEAFRYYLKISPQRPQASSMGPPKPNASSESWNPKNNPPEKNRIEFTKVCDRRPRRSKR